MPPTSSYPGDAPFQQRRVSWGAIFVGTVTAMALMVLFTTIGIAIGASTIDPQGGASLRGLGIGTGIYIVVTQMISLAVGGYAAARLTGVPKMMTALLHGAAVWSLATLLLAWAAIVGGGALFNATGNALQSAVRGTGSAVEAVVPDNLQVPDISELASQVSLSDLPPELQSTLRENNLTVDQLRSELQNAYRNVVSQQEQARAVNVLRTTLADAISNPGSIGEEVNGAIDRLFQGENAIFSEEDQQQALQSLQANLGISQQEAQQIVDAVGERVQQAIDQLRTTVEQLQERAVAAAEQATEALTSAALLLSLASVLCLLAALGGAAAGRPEAIYGENTW